VSSGARGSVASNTSFLTNNTTTTATEQTTMSVQMRLQQKRVTKAFGSLHRIMVNHHKSGLTDFFDWMTVSFRHSVLFGCVQKSKLVPIIHSQQQWDTFFNASAFDIVNVASAFKHVMRLDIHQLRTELSLLEFGANHIVDDMVVRRALIGFYLIEDYNPNVGA
jgi:hypothetical protein